MTANTTIARIFNIFIILICIVSIAGYFMMPLWKMNIKITFTDSFTDYIVDSADFKTDGESGIDVENTVRSVLSGTTVTIPFELRSSDALDAIFNSDNTPIEKTVEHNVDIVLEQLSGNIDAAVKSALSAVVNDAVTNMVNSIAEDEDSAEVLRKLEDAGIDSDYIAKKTSEIYDALNVESTTVDNVLAIVDSTFDEMSAAIASALGYEGDIEGHMDEFRAYIADMLNSLADENGVIAIGEILNDIISSLMNGEGLPESITPKSEAGVKVYPVFSATFASAAEESVFKATAGDGGDKADTSTSDALKQQMKDYIMGKISDDALNMIHTMLAGIGVLLLFTLFTWAYLILKILVKIASKNPTIKIGLPIWFGWIPFLIFALAPAIVFTIIINGVDIPELSNLAFNISEVLRMQFMSSGVVAFFAAIALIVISFVYIPLRWKIKKSVVNNA